MDNRDEVRDFLTSRRDRLTPDQAGVSLYGGRRRVKGLRREEVAMLAGMSADYYTRLERGNLSGGVCQIFCARNFFLSGTGCLSGTLSSRYLMSLCPFYSAGPGNRTFRAVPGLMLRVPVFFPSCSFRVPLPCPCRIIWRLFPCVT